MLSKASYSPWPSASPIVGACQTSNWRPPGGTRHPKEPQASTPRHQWTCNGEGRRGGGRGIAA
eukprot:7819936-Alexandrium_andersonii.AAC.1